MSGRGAYEQVSFSDTRSLSAISDISDPGCDTLRPNIRHDISPVSSLGPSQDGRSEHRSIDQNLTQISLTSTTSNNHKVVYNDASWLPITLRAYLIWVPTAIALICGLVIMLLYRHSKTNNGLGPATAAKFGWKFVPTLIAVIYTQLTTILFDDVKRTGPFARMARPAGSVPDASRTILETPRVWWITLAHGFQKKRNGSKRSWILFLTCILNVLASLGISPLSSALLHTQTMRISQRVEMVRLVPKPNTPLRLVDDRDMYFRAIAALLQKVPTSPWISDEYAVLPFWPMDGPSPVWNEPTLQAPRNWRAETTVFHNELKCSNLSLAATSFANVTLPSFKAPSMVASVRLDGPDGCQYNISADYLGFSRPWLISWADSNHIADGYEFYKPGGKMEAHPTANDKCKGNEVIILSSKWADYTFDMEVNTEPTSLLPNMTMRGYMCSSEVTMATLDVDAFVSETAFNVNFDKARFHETKSVVSDKLLNLTDLLRISTAPKWYEYIPSKGAVQPQSDFQGLAALLATQRGFNATLMLQDMELDQKGAYIRRRVFSELLRSSIDALGASRTENVSGEETSFERRVRVSMEAAALLASLFFVSFLLLLYITWFTRPGQRPLNLVHDPATILGTVALVAHSAEVLSSLRGLDTATTDELKSNLGKNIYSTSPGILHEDFSSTRAKAHDEDSTRKPSSQGSDRRSFFLRIWTLIGLALYLVALLTALAVVHRFATKSSLRQALFTYRVNSKSFGSFAPFSIIPTVLGIGVGLWWNGLDRSFRSLQPYLAMSKAPIKVTRGAAVSYQSSHWLLASSRAAKNNHWLLALVTLGTFLAQAFIISMSALFELRTGLVESQVSLNRSLEIRQAPYLRLENTTYPPSFEGRGVGWSYVTSTLEDLFTNLTTNWMYSAVIQVTMNASEPPWSKDGWSFVPLNLSKADSLQETHYQEDSEMQTMFTNYSPRNVTIKTPAIRARLECSPTRYKSDTLWWLYPKNYTDRANHTTKLNQLTYMWNVELPDVNYSTPVAPNGQVTQCCFNQSDPSKMENFSMPLAVGYWTMNGGQRSGQRSVTADNGNFTVKWIHGEGGFGADTEESPPLLLFRNGTKLQSLNCMPIIESSEAEITVDKQTQLVHSFTILKDAVSEDGAWSDNFVLHDPYDPNDPGFKAQLESSRMSNSFNYSYALQNLTASYGILFTEALLRASRLETLESGGELHSALVNEPLHDNVFNIRNNLTGLNLDFMSYASYVCARKDAAALLDQDTLMRHSKETFALFFQHYVSKSVSLMSGGWAFQPIGAKNEGLGGIANGTYPGF